MEQRRLIGLVAGYDETDQRCMCYRSSRLVVRVHLVCFPQLLDSGNDITYWQKCQSIQHAAEKIYAVVLPTQMYKYQTLNLPPRVLRQVTEAAVTFGVWRL